MGLDISVQDTHVVNNICPILPEVMDQEISLLFRALWWRCVVPVDCAFGPFQIYLWPLHSATCEDERVVAHVKRGE